MSDDEELGCDDDAFALEEARRKVREITAELDEERRKVGMLMQPLPDDPETSVWRMLQLWIANRHAEKRVERERAAARDAQIAEIERQLEAWRPVVDAAKAWRSAPPDEVEQRATELAIALSNLEIAERDELDVHPPEELERRLGEGEG